MRPIADRRGWLPWCLLVLLAAGAALADEPTEPTDPFDAARAAFMATDDPAARLQIVRTFLADHPDHARVPEVIQAGADLSASQHGDHATGIALAERQLAVSTDPDVLAGIRMVLVRLCNEPAFSTRLTALVAEHLDAGASSFTEQLTVLESAAGAQAWTLVDTWAAAARQNASGEQFAADYPDREDTPEELAAAGRNRQGLVDTYRGWSLANQGELDQALEHLARADRNLRSTFTGVPSGELYRYWGQALLMAGQEAEGLEKLVLAAAFDADAAADAIARRHHALLHPGESYDDFAWNVRRDHAPRIADFSVTDYEGQTRRFAELRGREVTLLAFWFPT
jgi:tetratricopeptide (TPR) repeat protein